MNEIAVAICWFIGLATIANVLQYFYAITYQKHWYIFLFLFLVIGVPGILLSTQLGSNPSFVNLTGILIGTGALLSYIIFETCWGRVYTIHDMYMYKSLPVSYYQLLSPNTASALSKSSEIFIQDIVMLVIVVQLLELGYSYIEAGLVFSLVVLIIHIPSPFILGKLYGNILLILATIFALFIPIIIDTISIGFYIVFAFHLFIYISLLISSRLMQKHFK